MSQKTERKAELSIVVQRTHEAIAVPTHVEHGHDALTRHSNLIGVREDPSQGGEVDEVMSFHEPLPRSQGWSRVGMLVGPLPDGGWFDESHCIRNVCTGDGDRQSPLPERESAHAVEGQDISSWFKKRPRAHGGLDQLA